jgi:hypothetical protein
VAIGREVVIDVVDLTREDGDFVAGKPQRVKRGGEVVTVMPGEPMPELWEMPTHRRRSLLRNRDVVFKFSARPVNRAGAELGRRLLAASGKPALEAVARESGLPTNGTKDDLVAALAAHAGWEV